MSNNITKKFYQSVANLCKTSEEPMVGNLPGMTLLEWLEEGDSDTLNISPEKLAAEWDSLNPENDN